MSAHERDLALETYSGSRSDKHMHGGVECALVEIGRQLNRSIRRYQANIDGIVVRGVVGDSLSDSELNGTLLQHGLSARD